MLLALTAAVMCLLAFSPTTAQAHAGHDHLHRHAIQAAKAAHFAPELLTLDRSQHRAAVMEAGFPTQLESHAGSLAPERGSGHGHNGADCPDGCCHSGGAGCCTALLLAAPGFGVPIAGRLAFSLPVDAGSGIRPDALPEPPNASA